MTIPAALYRALFLLAYTNKVPFLSFARHGTMLQAARERLFREHGFVEGSLEGLRLRCDVRQAVDLLAWIGRFERLQRSILKTLVRPGTTVVDAGAHIGVYTLLFSRWVGPGGRVEAFEPSPGSADRLADHIASNGCANVQLHRTALGEREGMRPLNIAADAGMTSFGPPVGGSRVERVVTVPVTTLDHVAAREEINGIDLLKLDVEGSEIPVLRGAERLLREHRIRAMVVEYNGEAQRGHGFAPQDLAETIRSAGFHVAMIGKKGPEDFPNTGLPGYAELLCTREPGGCAL